jgi:hypothetical protein
VKKNLSMLLALMLLGFGAVACGDDDDDNDNDNGNNDLECEADDDCEDDEVCNGDNECEADAEPEPEPDPNPQPDPNPEVDPCEDVECEEGEVCVDGECEVAGDECEDVCDEVSACPELLDACGEVLTGAVNAQCKEACADPDGRGQILAAAGLPCGVVADLALDGFGIKNACTPECAEYCDRVDDACGGQDVGFDPNSEVECRLACNEYATNGNLDDRAGDSVQCRIYHASVAQEVAADVHCPHAGVTGADVCANEPPSACETYCAIMGSNCADTFADNEACIAACDPVPADGDNGDATGETVQCLSFHAFIAELDDANCIEADPATTTNCVNE